MFIEHPTCLHRIAKLRGGLKETNTGWFSASGMIALFIKLDALFNTVVIATADIDDFCNEVAVAINLSFLVICVLTGIVMMAVNSVYAAHQLQTSDQKQYTWIAYLALGALLICFPLLLLTDNPQPLDCAFRCDSFSKNQTLQKVECDQQSNSGMRLGVSIVILAVVGSVSLLLLGCKHNTKGEGMV